MIGITGPSALPAAAARRAGARDWALLAGGAAMLALLAAFVLLWANFPRGYLAPWSPARDPVTIFRSLWRYPIIEISPVLFSRLTVAIILGLWACYLASAWLLRPARLVPPERSTVAIIIGMGLVFNVFLTFAMPPVLSTDIWDYGFEGRLVSNYHLDPYKVTARDRPDPIAPLMGWPDWPADYGPVATLLAAGVARLAGDSLLGTGLGFKGLATLFGLCAAGLIFLLTRRLNGESGFYPLMLFLWNPLLLVEVAGNGHNDVAMLACALLGLWLAVRGWRLAGIAALALSFGIKYVSAVLILFVVARELLEAGTWRRAAARAAGMAAVGVGVTVAAYLAFGSAFGRLLRLLSAPTGGNPGPNLLTTLPRDWIVALLHDRGIPIKPITVERDISRFWQVVFVILLLALLYRMARGHRTWPQVIVYAGAMTLLYLVLPFAGNYAWYLILPLGLALAGPRDRANAWLLGTCLGCGVAVMLLYAILLPA
jgi:hypothetical protein